MEISTFSNNEYLKHLDDQGRIKSWPSYKKRQLQIQLLKYLGSKFEKDRKYNENEVNDIIEKYHLFNQKTLLRKEMVEVYILKKAVDSHEYCLNSR